MELFAAVDVMEGRAVRLVQGAFDRSAVFGDPRVVAARFLAAGVPWLHVVDLDAARTGAPVNRDVVLTLAGLAHDAGARVQVGGGVRDDGTVDGWIAAGIDRVVLGTAAVERPDFARDAARRHPGRLALGLDYRRRPDGRLEPAVRGWTQPAAVDVATLLGTLSGAPFAAAVVTAIERDGTGRGPDVDGLATLLDTATVDVVASGGVGAARDLAALAILRSPLQGRALAGAVVGRALVDGTVDVEEAVAACAASG